MQKLFYLGQHYSLTTARSVILDFGCCYSTVYVFVLPLLPNYFSSTAPTRMAGGKGLRRLVP